MRGRAFRYAWRGVVLTLRSERNFRVHLAAAEGVLFLAGVERLPAPSVAVLLLTIGLVLSLELVNTAIERAVDIAAGERTMPLAAAAKDAAAGAVLASSILAASIGLLLLGPRLWMLRALLRPGLDWALAIALALLLFCTLRSPRGPQEDGQ